MRSSRSIKSAPCPDPLGGGDATLYQPKTQYKHEKIDEESEATTAIQSPSVQESHKLLVSEPDHSKCVENYDSPLVGCSTNNTNSVNETDHPAIKNEILTRPSNQILPQLDDGKIWKYKFDENYLKFIQGFTNHCEDRSNLIFDGSIFFDEDFFPRNMRLVDFVPINVVAPCVENLELQVPSYEDYCKFAACGSSLYDYFEDYQASPNREIILRNQVNFIFNSLQCPRLTNLAIDSTQVDEINTDQYPADRLSTWNENISYFISRHFKTLKFLQVNAIRYKGLSTNNSFPVAPKRSFPKLSELSISLWDDQGPPLANLEGSCNENWIPDWFPDLADQYWISLMKSQIYGMLTKLCWISAASLSWDDVFQPILDCNKNTLVCVHIMETGGLMDERNTKRRSMSNCSGVSFSSSTMVLSCAAFSKLEKLKCLSLRKPSSYLTHLEKLPKSIEELSIYKISIKSEEIETLKLLPALKVLRLSYNTESGEIGSSPNQDVKESYGVNKKVLKTLLYTRALQELCIWGHCLELNISELESMKSFNVKSVLDRINKYLYV